MDTDGKRLVGALLTLAVALMAFTASAGAASGTLTSVGVAPHVPAGAQRLGALSGATRLHVTVTLRPRDPVALESYALAVATPDSPLYRHYLSVAQFARRFGPSDAQITRVLASLRAHGLDPGAVMANHLAIPVRASAAQLGSAFSTSLQRYSLPGTRTAFANTSAPKFDANVAPLVGGVVGLSALARPRPLAIRARTAGAAAAAAVPHVATGGPQPCADAVGAATKSRTYTADQIAAAYRFSGLYGTGDLGAGQTIALYELEPFSSTDVATYQSCYGTSTPVANVPVDGGPSGTAQGEAVLDVETLIGLAPRANVLVYSGPNSASDSPGSGVYDTYAAIINENRAKVISTSWGICEPQEGSADATGESVLFQEAAVQGQSILAAAGDNGATDCTDDSGNPTGGLAVDDPASQPFVTGVGGTSLLAPGPPPAEAVWDSRSIMAATGGGISSLWSMPSYQSQAPAALGVINGRSSGAPCGSSLCREVPDVSSDADPSTGYVIYFGGAWVTFGGTSVGAPTWAALFALANAAPGCAGKPIGFGNPALYGIGAFAYHSTFNDILVGNNGLTADGGFGAAPGYDMASGLGTPLAAPLAGFLCDRVSVSAPPSQHSLAGTTVSVTVAGSSTASAPLTYAAAGLPAGLSIDPQSGVISGRPTSAGTTTVTVLVRDAVGQSATSSFAWSVIPATVTIGNPGSQATLVGAPARLAISASANNGQAPAYLATGLPAGLSINSQTGLISGKPTRVGRFRATVFATVSGGIGTASFPWVIGGPPASARSSLRGVASGNPALSFVLAAGRDAPPLATIVVRLPSGLSFASRPGRGISVRDAGGRRLRSTVKRTGAGLVITLRAPAKRLQLAVGSPAISVSRGLAARVARHRAGKLVVLIDAIDVGRQSSRVTLRLSAS